MSKSFAIIRASGRQYKVTANSIIQVNRVHKTIGAHINFDTVIVVDNDGNINIKPQTVSCEILEHSRGKKIRILKFRRRKNSMNRRGHRQDYTILRINDITEKI